MLLQITKHCSAGCTHCPYQAEQIFYSLKQIKLKLANQNYPFVTVTGGEPLEHPEFEKICSYLESQEIPYRVATGGHIPMDDPLPQLLSHKFFLGINMGTDILSPRCSRPELRKIWKRNLALLESSKVSWSLTVTTDLEQDFAVELEAIQEMKVVPKFIMINQINECGGKEEFINWLQNSIWKDLPCI